MEKFENIFRDYKGLVIFYIIIAVLAIALSRKVKEINSQAQKTEVSESYYAIIFYK